MEFKNIINGVEKSLKIDPINGIQRNNMTGDCLVPPGKISMFSTETPPDGWLECNGQQFDPNIYIDLSNAIGKIWGDNNSYKVPDFRGLFLQGAETNNCIVNQDNNLNHSHINLEETYPHTHGEKSTNNSGSHDHGYIKHFMTENGGSNQYSFRRGNIGGLDTAWNELIDIYHGMHNHAFYIPDGIDNMKDSNNVSFITSNVGDSEFRPKNYALLHCIKY